VNEKESEKFIELEEKLYENMIEGMRIILEIVREAAKPETQDQKIIERAWSLRKSLNVKEKILGDIGSSKEEIMLLTAKIFEKLPIEIRLFTVAKMEDKGKRRIFCKNPEQN